MNDPANNLLITALNEDRREPLLWVVDENLPDADLQQLQAASRIQAITNRVDVARRLSEKNVSVTLSDFDFEFFKNQSFAAVYYRVSKEKALVHHVINQAAKYLRDQGEMILAGSKNEGIKTYCAKTAIYLGSQPEKQKGIASAQLCRITRAAALNTPLDDKAYTLPVEVSDGQMVFFSKPGLYGWNKIDRGSQLLIAQLPDVLARINVTPKKIIDLGCGYGYLSVMTNQLVAAEFIATDNNVAAVDYCRKNFDRFGVRGEVVPEDCGAGLSGADLVICNPPFHQGFAVEGDLTRRFLQAAHAALIPGGCAVFVVNSFIPIEKKARGIFNQVECLVNDKHFKVMLLGF